MSAILWTKYRRLAPRARAAAARLGVLALLLAGLLIGRQQPLFAGTLLNFNTRVGTVTQTFQVDMFDDVTPQTVANFLNYVNANRYQDTIVHRNELTFVIQGGGYKTSNFTASPLPNTATHIPTFASPANEFHISNDRAGTIAMAKSPGDPNSATSEWFINLKDNASILDGQNGGFTVFGWVVGNGMNVVNSITALTPSAVNFPGYASIPINQRPFLTVPKSAQGDFVNIDSITIDRTHPSFQNPILAADVNNTNTVSPQDFIIIANSLLAFGSHNATGEFIDDNFAYVDTNGSGTVTPIDAHIVANAILSQMAQQQAAPLAAPLFAESFNALAIVPEPSSLVLAIAGLLGLAARSVLARRRRRPRPV